jgi:catechol 2,3-dioxygenase-like lactoylglutathione lyase family enzyme
MLFATILFCCFQPGLSIAQQLKPQQKMKLNAGIITSKLAETKAFYTTILGFGVSFENDFYLLLHTPGKQAELSFLLPGHASQQPLFHPEFQGQGMYLTIEVEDVDLIYQELKKDEDQLKQLITAF